jgi:hypothetical protein
MFSLRCGMAALVLWGLAMPSKADQDILSYLRAQFGHTDIDPSETDDSQALIRHDIDDFGRCSFFTSRGVRWSRRFEDGARLELRCQPDRGSLLPGYRLYYVDAAGARSEIARCVFGNGLNRGFYYTSSDSTDELVRVEWVNVDGGKDDGPSRKIDATHVTGPEEPYVDVVRWIFDARRRRIECINQKYEYGEAGLRLPSHPRGELDNLDNYIGAEVPELRRSFVKPLDN